MIVILSFLPPKCPLLASTGDAAGEGLVNINVLDTIIVLVMLYGESNAAYANSFPLEPTDTLQSENVIGARIREGFVLNFQHRLHMIAGERDKMRTKRNVPVRLRMVKSAGTAIVVDGKIRVRPN